MWWSREACMHVWCGGGGRSPATRGLDNTSLVRLGVVRVPAPELKSCVLHPALTALFHTDQPLTTTRHAFPRPPCFQYAMLVPEPSNWQLLQTRRHHPAVGTAAISNWGTSCTHVHIPSADSLRHTSDTRLSPRTGPAVCRPLSSRAREVFFKQPKPSHLVMVLEKEQLLR